MLLTGICLPHHDVNRPNQQFLFLLRCVSRHFAGRTACWSYIESCSDAVDFSLPESETLYNASKLVRSGEMASRPSRLPEPSSLLH
jgi:hypothetical protein